MKFINVLLGIVAVYGAAFSAHSQTTSGAIEQLPIRTLTHVIGHDGSGLVGREPVTDFLKPGSSSPTTGNVATWGTSGNLITDGGKPLPFGAIVGTTDAQTLTNKTLTAPAITDPVTIGGVTQVFPTSGLLVGASDTQTLTNKSIDASQINSGTLPSMRLPAPTTSLLGGVLAIGPVSNQFLTSIGTTGLPTLAQPSFANLSGAATASQLNLTSLQVNRGLTWPAIYMPGFNTSLTTAYIIDPAGSNSTVFAATRTSDNTGSGRQNVIADTCLVVPDNTVNTQVASWCRYEQANIPVGSSPALHVNDENSIENKGVNAPQTDPFSNFAPGGKAIENLRLNAGVGNTGVNNISNYASMLYNGGLAYSGLVVGSGALDTSSGYASAVSMPPNVGMSWYNSAGDRSWRIFSNTFSGHGQVILGTDTFNLYLGTGGYNALNITTTGLGINKTAAYSLDVNGAAKASQFLSTAGTQVLSSCGTSPAMTANSSKHGGRFTTGTGTVNACTLTFDTAFPTAAFCTISPVGATAIAQSFYISSQTSAAFTINFSASAPSTSYQYVCMGD